MYCEVRLDRDAAAELFVAGDVHDAGGEHQRVSGLEVWRHTRSKAVDRRATADAAAKHPRAIQSGLWLATDVSGVAGARLPGEQAAGGTADARASPPGAPQ